MKHLPTLCLAATLATPLITSATTVGLHLHTIHASAGYNDTNPGVYVVADSGFGAGIYRNSINKTSVHLDYTLRSGPWALTMGAVTGYGKPRPLLIPSVAVGMLRLSLIPYKSGALHLSLEKEF